jgi:hypothetical protein
MNCVEVKPPFLSSHQIIFLWKLHSLILIQKIKNPLQLPLTISVLQGTNLETFSTKRCSFSIHPMTFHIYLLFCYTIPPPFLSPPKQEGSKQDFSSYYLVFYKFIYLGVVVKALCYKPEGRGFGIR